MENICQDFELKEKTFVISTNNVSMLRYFDRVMLVDNGRICEFDIPSKIIESESFKRLIKIDEEKDNEPTKETHVSFFFIP